MTPGLSGQPGATGRVPVAPRLIDAPRGMAAEGLRLMLAMKGLRPDREALGRLRADPLAALAEAATAGLDDTEVIHAETALLSQSLAAAEHLGRVMDARNPRDLDLAIHRLRMVLVNIQRRSGLNVGPDLHDGALAPVLWRMALLDRAFGSYLGIGLDGLTQRTGLLLARHDNNRILGPSLARNLIAVLRASGAFIACPDARCDWSRALGPAGRN